MQQLRAKTDITACFQLYGLELDCRGLNYSMQEFWVKKDLVAFTKDAISSNKLLTSVQKNLEAGLVVSYATGRELKSDGHMRALLAEAFSGIDGDAFASEVETETTRLVGEQLAIFMRDRKKLENPGELIKIITLRGRTTVSAATHIELEAKIEYERDFANELGERGFASVIPIPTTFGLIRVEVEAKMEVGTRDLHSLPQSL